MVLVLIIFMIINEKKKKMIIKIRIILVTTLFFCGISSSYAQQDSLYLDRLEKRAVEIANLNNEVVKYKDSVNDNAIKLNKLKDSLKLLKSKLSEIEDVKADKNVLENLLKQKSDSITILKTDLLDKDKQLATQTQSNKQEVKEAIENSKNKTLKSLIDYYKNKSFDDLVKSSTQQSARNDKNIIGHSNDIEPLLSDLEIYYKIKLLFQNEFNSAKIKEAQNQFNQLEQLESSSIDKLKNDVENYQIFNEGLKETIEKIIALDGRESVIGMPKEIQNLKFNKIMAEISFYIFNYDFNFLDYPYLTDVMLDIIKLKAPNPDANIFELLQKL